MYSRLQLATKFLKYYFSASNGKGHGIHSPFVFNFITTVLNDRKRYDAYSKIEKLRQGMLGRAGSETILTIEDFGAGSSSGRSNERSVASIVANAAKPKKYGQLLYRIVKRYQPQTILELGTSLGITTSYLAMANPSSKLVTLEGSRDVAKVARQNFNQLEFPSIELIEGNFDRTLSSAIDQLSSLDFVFIDGNHRKEPTERYFQQILSKTNANSILIFDDIHWSPEMEEAWESIKADTRVRCTLDLFFIGIVFFREEFKEKQHFAIRF